MKGDCNKSIKMLFSQGVEDLHDDNFEGSVDEHQIFKEVFFGNDGGQSSKRCLVTAAINFENDHSKYKDVSFCLNGDNSVMTGQEDFQNAKEDSGSGCLSEEFTMSTRNDPEVQVKRMKLSVEELSNAKPYLETVVNSSTSSKEVVSGLCQPVSTVTCRLVESSGQGVSSRCYLLKGHVGDMGDKDVSNCRLSSLDGSNEKAIVVSKAIASPVSQESQASKLLVSRSESVRCPKPRWKESSFVELDKDEMSEPKVSTKDPRTLLRYHIHHLLRAAGWRVGRRKRSVQYKRNGEYVYKSPEGRPIREFHRAWNLCGQRLLAYAHNVVHDCDDAKEWTDLTQFRFDLDSTLTEIEEQMNTLEAATALARWWYLLDPFAKAVFIDKKISSLREGKLVEAKRSVLTNAHLKHDAVLLLENVDSTGNQIAEKPMTISDQPCRSDSTSCQTGPCLYEVPICSQNAYSSPGGSESVFSWCVNKEGGQCIETRQFSMDDASFSEDAVLKRKAHKKSKKISEIKLTNLYQNDDLGLSASCKADAYDISKRSIQLESNIAHYCFEANVKSDKRCEKSPLYSSKHRNEKNQLRFKKLWSHSGSPKRCAQVKKDNKHRKELNVNDSMDEAPLHVKSESLDFQTWRHDMKSSKPVALDDNGRKKPMACQLKDDDLLLSAIIKNKSFRSTTKSSSVKRDFRKSKALRKYKSQKGSCRLLPRSFSSLWSGLGVRTVLSWLIDSGVIYLNEVIQYRNPKDDGVVKDGLVTRDGILCRCCDKMLSVSEFKSHAGFKLKRPCLNLFMESGKSFTLCQLEAWSAEYKVRKSATRTVRVNEMDQNDDSCGLCGDVGELICCDSCPSTFHHACLYAQELPEGSWYCSQCSCWICGDVVNDKDASKSPGALKCSQCEHKYHEDCLKQKGTQRGVVPHTWFCGQSCQEVHSGLQSWIGRMNSISDGFSWTLLRCIHGDQKVHSAQRLVALKAECNLKLAVALTIMEECFLPMVDPMTGIDMIPHVVYNWGSEFARLNYEGFYTVILEKDDVLTSVASIRIHGATVAEMPLIATCSKYRRQGMCRRLMNAIEEMLKSFKVEKLVVSAIPSLVETWTEGFGFAPLEDHERKSLSKINLMVFPGTIWLKKPLCDNQGAVQERTHAEQCPTIEPWQQDNTNSGLKQAPSQKEIMLVDCNDSQVGEDQDGNLQKDFSKLSCEEPHSTLKASPSEIVCNVESLVVYDNRKLLLNEQSETNR